MVDEEQDRADRKLPNGPRLATSTLYGYLDGVRNGMVCGWVSDIARPGRRVRVRIVGAEGSVSVVARLFRADVEAAGFGEGYCGFMVAMDALPLGSGTESLRVEVAREGLELVGSPCSVNSSTATIEQLVLRHEMWSFGPIQELSS
jgi:hypothetical protein